MFLHLSVGAICLFIMPNKNHVTVSAKVPKEYAKKLKDLAKEKGISLGELIRECIRTYMSAEEE